MTLPASGQIKFSDIRSEMNGAGSVRLSDYYKGKGTPTLYTNWKVPASGTIKLSDYQGAVSNAITTMDNPNMGTRDSYNDNFGTPVITNGVYVASGAPNEPLITSNTATRGLIYIHNASTGALVYTLYNPNANTYSTGDGFGQTIAGTGAGMAMNASKIAIGAYAEDSSTLSNSGKVYVFSLTNGQLLWTLSNPDETQYSFGGSVSMTEQYIVIGSPSSSTSGGCVHIYDATNGSFIRTLTNPNPSGNAQDDVFGWTVAVNGNNLIVSNPNEYSYSGAVFHYNASTGGLIRTIVNPNSNTVSSGDGFGRNSIAISNNYITVTAPYENDSSGYGTGRVYVFRVSDGVLVRNFGNPNPVGTSPDDYFGDTISMSDTVVSINAPYESGVGRIYNFSISTGSLLSTLINPNMFGADTDYFGYYFSTYENTLVARGNEQDLYGTSSGKVHVYNISTATKTLTIDNPNIVSSTTGQNFGGAIAVNDNFLLISARFARSSNASANGVSSGGGIVYVHDTQTLNRLRILSDPDYYGSEVSSDLFGEFISMYGNTAVIAATQDADWTVNKRGVVHGFNVDTGTKLYTVVNPNPYDIDSDDNFGQGGVAIYGSYFVASSYYESDQSGGVGYGAGKVYVFNSSTGALVRTINDPNAYSTAQYDAFGVSLALYGNNLVVGATGEDDAGGGNSGKAYVFNVTTGALIWTLNNPNAYGTSTSDYFGSSVAINDKYILVSSIENPYTSAENYMGVVYVFSVSTGSLLWTFTAPNKYGDIRFDFFGAGIKSMSLQGDYALIGAPNDESTSVVNGTGGVAFLYDLTTGTMVRSIDNPNAYSLEDFGDNFGITTTLNANVAYVASTYEGDANTNYNLQSGKVYKFYI